MKTRLRNTTVSMWVSLILMLATASGGHAVADTFYLAPDGDDRAAGTASSPWQNLDEANRRLTAGDTLLLLPGEHVGVIAPRHNGTAAAPVTYRAARRGEARLVPPPNEPAINLFQRKHIHVEGLAIDGDAAGRWMDATESQGLVIVSCRLTNAADKGAAMRLMRCRDVRLLDNVFSKDRVDGNMVEIHLSERVLIEGNSFTRVGHCPLEINASRYVVVRANCFRNVWGRSYEFWANSRMLIEGNIITQNRDSAFSADSRAKNLYIDSIFRFNRVYGNRHTPMDSGSFMPVGAAPTHYYRQPFRMVNSRIYHNTIADNLGYGWELWGLNISSNLFQNNIFAGNDWTGANVQIRRGEDVVGDNRILSNLLRGSAAGQTVVRYKDEYWTAEQANARTKELWPGSGWSEFADNIDVAPGFREPSRADYRLKPDSDAIDAGQPLAVAIGEDRGRVVPVSDGVSFYDGFGIAGEHGDWIVVGSSDQPARIERVELRDAMPALLYLDRDVQWQDGSPVSLAWSGEAPDLGAYEATIANPHEIRATASDVTVESGEAVQFAFETSEMSHVREVHWDFEDGQTSSHAAPTHTFQEKGHYGVTVRATFEDGKRAIDVLFIEVTAQPDGAAPLVEADFEPANRGETWGYLFKVHRSWLTAYKYAQRDDGEGYCLRLFYDDNKSNQAAAVLAPGLWAIDEHPVVAFSYRIAPGTPVATRIDPFPAPGRASSIILGGTAEHQAGAGLGLHELIADGEWHDLVIDLRGLRKHGHDLKHVYRFMFATGWERDHGQFFEIDDFRIVHRSAHDKNTASGDH